VNPVNVPVDRGGFALFETELPLSRPARLILFMPPYRAGGLA
jgi:hypothetical protein